MKPRSAALVRIEGHLVALSKIVMTTFFWDEPDLKQRDRQIESGEAPRVEYPAAQ
jgi:hypothetical protein